MEIGSKDRARVAAAYREYRALTMPKIHNHVELWEADVDLAEEDGYLAGLVDTYLTLGSLGVASIVLDGTIDDRLQQARSYATAQESLARLERYRSAMFDLAETLSEAAGVPLIRSRGTA